MDHLVGGAPALGEPGLSVVGFRAIIEQSWASW
jgi:hypothetical protein